MHEKIVIGGRISLDLKVDGSVSTSLTVDGVEGTLIANEEHGREPYTGAYEAIPSAVVQIIPTKDKVMTADFKVKPIPSNYGLISWNGSELTVS